MYFISDEGNCSECELDLLIMIKIIRSINLMPVKGKTIAEDNVPKFL
jgi:hypothetical protein